MKLILLIDGTEFSALIRYSGMVGDMHKINSLFGHASPCSLFTQSISYTQTLPRTSEDL